MSGAASNVHHLSEEKSGLPLAIHCGVLTQAHPKNPPDIDSQKRGMRTASFTIFVFR